MAIFRTLRTIRILAQEGKPNFFQQSSSTTKRNSIESWMEELNCVFSEKTELNYPTVSMFLRFLAFPFFKNSEVVCSRRSIFGRILFLCDPMEILIVKELIQKRMENFEYLPLCSEFLIVLCSFNLFGLSGKIKILFQLFGKLSSRTSTFSYKTDSFREKKAQLSKSPNFCRKNLVFGY